MTFRIIATSLTLLITLLMGQHTCAQSIKFQQLLNDQILENKSILTIAQDNQGRLFFGGKESLFVYDSRTIKNIFETDSIFINGEYLNKIAIDDNNNIFLGTAYGLLIYNHNIKKYLIPNEQKFITDQVNDLLFYKNKIYAAVSSGLYVISINQKTNTYAIEKHTYKNSTTTLKIVGEHTLLFASGAEVLEIQTNSKSLQPTLKFKIPVVNDFITSICQINGQTWVGTHASGIFIYENNSLLRTIDEKNSILLSNNIRKIKSIQNDVYIGTLKGLTVINRNNVLQNYFHENNEPWSISQNSIYEIFEDNQNILWIGTYFGGLNAVYPSLIPTLTLTSKPASNYRLLSDIVSSVAEDSDNLYIGTEEMGVQIINKETKKTTNLPTQSNLVKSILLLSNKLYIAQHNGGLSIYNTDTKQLQNNIFAKQKDGGSNNINQITADQHGQIYLATDNGLFLYNGVKESAFAETKGRVVYNIVDNKKDRIYTILRGKLWSKLYRATNFEELPLTYNNQYLKSICVDTKGYIWTNNNKQVYQLINQKLELVYETDDFSLGTIFVHDDLLWLGTDKGLLRYDIKQKKLNKLTVEDGLTTNNLSTANFFLSNNNDIYITSLKGITKINPKELQFNDIPPSVLLSQFNVFDKEMIIAKNEEDNNMPYHIKLPYDQNYFSVEFASSNFIKPQKNQYKYKLEGFDDDWKQTRFPVARYMNIPPGKYTLQMMGSNNDDVWCEHPLLFEIIITPPIWKTWWAYTLYLVAFLALLHFVIKFIVERQLLINADKEHEKKIKFFTQISHEIRTPLTLITVPIEEIITETEDLPDIQTKAKRLRKNANKLLSIVNELLDFKKIDDGKEQLALLPQSMKPYLEEFFYLFSDLAVAKSLNFYIKKIDESSSVLIDTKKFDKVLFNLLSNAIKYSNVGGTIFMEALKSPNNYTIRIVDNGIGISDNNHFKIFEEYYRDPKAQDSIGTGIGLALTKKIIDEHLGSIRCSTESHEGINYTIFTIKLPIINTKKNKSETYYIPDKDTSPSIDFQKAEKEVLLLVEDNRELSETISNLFKERYTVITAFDGQEGLELATQYLPDIILSDVMMPHINGIEMCEKIKKNIQTSHIPIILLTADTNETTQISGLEYGANVYLQKPFNTNVLQLTVKNLLEIATKNRKEFDIQSTERILNTIDHDFIIKLESIIDENLLNKSFGVDFLAKELCMSQPILYKKLKSVTDLSVNNFIKQYRFKKAIGLLKQETNISEVAYAVGFSDRKYFSKEFKKHFGINPSEYLDQSNN